MSELLYNFIQQDFTRKRNAPATSDIFLGPGTWPANLPCRGQTKFSKSFNVITGLFQVTGLFSRPITRLVQVVRPITGLLQATWPTSNRTLDEKVWRHGVRRAVEDFVGQWANGSRIYLSNCEIFDGGIVNKAKCSIIQRILIDAGDQYKHCHPSLIKFSMATQLLSALIFSWQLPATPEGIPGNFVPQKLDSILDYIFFLSAW